MINSESKLAQEFWMNGRLAHCPVLDFHAHMGNLGGGYLPKKTAEAMLSTMDKCNTLLTCFCGHETLFNPSYDRDADRQVVLKYPDRYKAYFGVNGRYTDPEKDLRHVAENPDVYVGFKFLCGYFKVKLSDPRHEAYFKYADDNKLLVLAHTWSGSASEGPEEVEKILKKYRNLIFIAGHSLHNEWERAVELAKEYPNLYLELTAVLDDRGGLDLFVERLGSDRILFGTDLPWFSTHHGIGAVLSAYMTDDDRRNILYRNGAKLLERFPWFKPLWTLKGSGDYK